MTKINSSFLVPSFNHSKYLSQCLNSILQNDTSNIELLIADDASSDGSCEIIHQWIEENKNKFFHTNFIQHEKNLGITKTLNELISIAEGEIILGVASDDYVMPNGIKLKTDFMLSNRNILGAFSDGIAVGLNDELYSESILASSKLKPDDLNQYNIRHTVLTKWCEPMNLQFWRRSAFKSHGGEFEFDGNIFCEDLNFAIWAISNKSFSYLNKKCVAYRCRTWPQSPYQVKSSELNKMHLDAARCYEIYHTSFSKPEQKYLKNKASYYRNLASGNDSEARFISLKLRLFNASLISKANNIQKYLINLAIRKIKSMVSSPKAIKK